MKRPKASACRKTSEQHDRDKKMTKATIKWPQWEVRWQQKHDKRHASCTKKIGCRYQKLSTHRADTTRRTHKNTTKMTISPKKWRQSPNMETTAWIHTCNEHKTTASICNTTDKDKGCNKMTTTGPEETHSYRQVYNTLPWRWFGRSRESSQLSV